MGKRFRPVALAVPSLAAGADLRNSFEWDSYLEETLTAMERSGSPFDDQCSEFAVPVRSFFQAPFAEYMKYFKEGIKVEVLLDGDYNTILQDKTPLFWIARVIKIAGYRLLLRYEGMDRAGDEAYDFWVNVGSTHVRHVGYCAEDVRRGALLAPEQILDRQSDWNQYALSQLHAFRSIAAGWHEIQKKKLLSCKFKRGDRVELLDSLVSARVRPARVDRVVGSRVFVKLCIKDMDPSTRRSGEENEDPDPQEDGVWMDQDSPLLFHVGWASKVGYSLSANSSYTRHAEDVAMALREGMNPPFAKQDARPEVFQTFFERPDWKKLKEKKKLKDWEKGMKLEVLDPLDSWKEMRVATVLDILEDDFLKIGFDGEAMEEDPVPLHKSSPLLFPVGYCKKYDIRIRGPGSNSAEAGKFEWSDYLEQCNATAAPDYLFEKPIPDIQNWFRAGAKVEAVDMCEPVLICPATIAAVKGRLIKVSYDGWDESFDQYFDHRSNNIFPIGWCEMHGYKLEPPRVEVKKKPKK